MTARTATLAILVLLVAAVAPGVAGAAAADGTMATTEGAAATDRLAGASVQGACEFPFSATDATGTEVTVEQRPERVVTLGPSAAQTMWEFGAQAQVVGVTQYSSYLAGADAKANVSGTGQTYVSVEKVVGQEPDLVLAANVVPDETVQKLRQSGLTVYKFAEATSLDAVVEKTRLTGSLTGNCAAAQETADRVDSRVQAVRQAVEGEDRPRVLYTFFGYTAGEGTFIHSIIEAAGGTNVAAEAGIQGYKQISEETVAQQNPEWIVLNSDDTQGVPQSEAYQSTTAAKQGNVVTLNASYISQPAPRVVQPLTKLATALHPEAMAEADLNASATATATGAATGTADATATEGPAVADGGTTTAGAQATTGAQETASPATRDEGGDGGSGSTIPGFGVAPALAALLLAAGALVARRD